MSFETLEHTGDLAVRLRAPDLAGLIVEGVWALREFLFEGPPAAGVKAPGPERRRARVEGVDAEDTLVQALSEALHILQEEDLYPLEVAVVADVGAELEISGVHERRVDEIKAVTYHAVAIERCDAGLETTVVFDV